MTRKRLLAAVIAVIALSGVSGCAFGGNQAAPTVTVTAPGPTVTVTEQASPSPNATFGADFTCEQFVGEILNENAELADPIVRITDVVTVENNAAQAVEGTLKMAPGSNTSLVMSCRGNAFFEGDETGTAIEFTKTMDADGAYRDHWATH
jgi:hypothetical protein